MWQAVLICSMLHLAAGAEESPSFLKAEPVWVADRAEEKNLTVGFCASFEVGDAEQLELQLTASTVYRIFVNGVFCGCGPARGPHGFFRVDRWDITPYLSSGKNTVAIEVAGYNANSYCYLDQPSFLQAELRSGDTVLAATGEGAADFNTLILSERVQKVQRYSFQRPFMEVYNLTPTASHWRIGAQRGATPIRCATQPTQPLLRRGVPYPHFTVRDVATQVASGQVKTGIRVRKPWQDRSLLNIGEKLKGYRKSELVCVPSLDLQQMKNTALEPNEAVCTSISQWDLGTNAFQILDMGQNLSGFIRLNVTCDEATQLYVLFDEMLQKGDVDWKRLGCVNAVVYHLEPGEYALESFEPYTLRYLKLLVTEGACQISNVGMRLYENPDTERAVFQASNPRFEALFEAGRSTYAQNAVDIFMDCPHRERAGWLCDSFFTARTAHALSGATQVEKNFLENFALPKSFAHLPEGMLPMCYPADHYDGVFIPNWSLWFILQLGEYQQRSGDDALVALLKPRVEALLRYFEGFENEDGLLESLESWIFVEWSKANGFVRDVNYPSNMLYAAALDTAARLYAHSSWQEKAVHIRDIVRTQAFRDGFFVDHAVRKDGVLNVLDDKTEVCQYFAFYFGVATPQSHADLWRILREEFGPQRKETKAYPNVHMANAFIGNMLRMELLSRQGEIGQLLEESIGYWYYMVERTGTLWENAQDHASLNHGFASHICHCFYRDVLGVYHVDRATKTIHLRFADVPLSTCSGVLPIGEEEIRIRWTQDDETLRYQISAPNGYRITTQNLSGKKLIRE